MLSKDQLMKGVLPALFMSTSVGQIYAFTNFSGDIASYIGSTEKIVQIAFSLGIFFLGMGAAFFGKLVEKDIKKSAIIGSLLFLAGLLVTQLGVVVKSAPLVLLGYGAILGLGTGIIYITPVKTLMMWFPKQKAIASAIPIIFFGLGSSLSTLLYGKFIQLGICKVFSCYALFYLPFMIAGAWLLHKPADADATTACGSSDFKYSELLKKPFFIRSWMFMLLNISAGLSLIPLAKKIMGEHLGYSAGAIALFIGLSGLFNGAGRLAYAYGADKLKNRADIILIILVDSMIAWMLMTIWHPMFGVALLLINACYGAGFSVIPSILSDRFGMSDISKIHGAVLSAWGIAGLIGNSISIRVLESAGYRGVLCLLFIMYIVNLSITWMGMREELAEVKVKS